MGEYIRSAVLLALVISMASFAGCLGSDDEKVDSVIDLIIYYDQTSGMIQENIQNGQQVSFSGVELAFDYTYTKSSAGAINSFYFEAGDGSNRVVVDANETGEISYTYATHGLFTAILGATDSAGNEENTSLTIRIDKQIQWGQSGTTEPDVMIIDTTPDCECPAPNQVAIDSTVENPQNFGNLLGGPVSVNWVLTGEGVVRESGQEQVADGQNAQWVHSELNVGKQNWELVVELDNSEEQVNIDHDVTINYNDEESNTNPLPNENTN